MSAPASELLRIIDKALAFNQQSTSKSNIALSEESKPATDSRPAIRIPDLGDARSLPAFDAAMDEMTSRYFENGNNPRMLWPLLDQYLQPKLYRHSLRTYMTSDEVTGYWLVEKYVSYARQSLTLLQLGHHHLQQGELGASENAALKDFILTSTQEMYALVICAVQTVGKERPISVDGSPLELDDDLFANLTSKLNEIVSAQDPNIALRELAHHSAAGEATRTKTAHARHFVFGLLPVFGPSTSSSEVNSAESHYKAALMTRKFGLNRN